MRRSASGWVVGDNLPVSAPFLGWRWYVGLLLIGAAAAAALGVHLQARQQLQHDSQRLQALRSGREASLQARTQYERAARELESLRVLAPQMSQLELLDRVSQSGIFVSPSPAATSTTATPSAPGTPPAGPIAGAVPVRLIEWDVRGGQLKMTLELPERDVALLDITRRLEGVPGLGALRVGQEGSGNTLTLSASIAELVPVSSTESLNTAARGR